MFFVLSKIFAALFLPLPLFYLVIFFLFRKLPTRKLRLFAYGLWFAVWFFSSALGSSFVMKPLENVYPAQEITKIEKADVVVVLGGMIDAGIMQGSRPEFHDSADRLIAAVELLHRGKAGYMLISGGSGLLMQGGYKEGQVLAQWFNDLKIFQGKILSESISRNTRENAVESAKILAEKKLNKVILVTSAFHMKRAVGCFEKAGVKVVAYPVDFKSARKPVFPESYFPSPGAIDNFSMATRELIGILAYKVYGYI